MEKLKIKIPVRFLVIFLCALNNMLSYTIRTNFSVTIVAMVNSTVDYHNSNDTCEITYEIQDEIMNNKTNNHTNVHRGDFDWSDSLQGIILGAYYYGYIITNINGGQLSDWIGSRLLCGMSILASGILTLLTPITSYWNVYAMIVLRVLVGLFQGVLTPSLYTMLAYWVPPNERSTALAILAVGGNIGAIMTLPLSGYLSEHGFAGGWPSVFYVFGGLGCLFFIPWMYFSHNTPLEHPHISKKELEYIQSNVTVTMTRKKRKIWVPWCSMLTSPRLWIVAIAKFCGSWGNLVLMSKLPAYLQSVLHFPIEKNGLINALVYISFSLSLIILGYISDFVVKRKLLNITVSRKIFEAIAMAFPAILMALIPSVGCNQTFVILLLVASMGFYGFSAGGDTPIVVDIAPDYSGTVYGLTNSIASVPGFLAPLCVGLILDNNKSGTMASWSIVFYITSAIYIFGGIIFVAFISAKPEPWGRARTGTARSTIDASYIVRPKGTLELNITENDKPNPNQSS